jgi:hypothetical protein
VNVAPNGNRAARRTAGVRGATRPAADLGLTQIPGAVLLGLRGAGFVRLTPGEARKLAAELDELADTVQGALS